MTANERELLEAADELADVVRARWQQEEIRRRIHDPGPLPVRWCSAAADLVHRGAPTDLAGTLNEIVSCYRRVQTGRLVILGQAGAGKSMLAIRLVLDLLKPSTAAGAVPVLIGINSWHPAKASFHDWLVTQLTRYYPGLAKPSRSGSTLAARLIETGRILPVLDGFDEIADGLRQPALAALNQIALPFVLTSRPDEYRDAVMATRVLRDAAAIELTDLTVKDLADYLPRTAPYAANETSDAVTSWDPVLRELAAQPDSPLATALTTPLVVGLARAVYSDSAAGDPTELLDNKRFPTVESISDHLLTSFVHTAYPPQPLDRAVGIDQRWSAEQATHWLRFLATHLTRQHTTDLAWWKFGTALRRRSRTLVVSLFAGVTGATTDWLVEGVASAFGVQIGTSPWFVSGLLIGVLAAVLMVISYGLMMGRHVPVPVHLRISMRGGARRQSSRTTRLRLRLGILCGFVFGACLGTAQNLPNVFTSGSAAALVVWLVDAIMFGLVYALGVALVLRVIGMIAAPVDLVSAGSPADLIRANRTMFVVPLLVLAPLFAGFIVATVEVLRALGADRLFGLELDWVPSLVVAAALISAIGGGVGFVLGMTSWGHWVMFARIWLPLTRRLPWTMVTFLDDACQRGVLRQSGPYYQFRHARLQAHLASGDD